MPDITLDYIRDQIVGYDLAFATPFGERHLFYADYTASGRGLSFIEDKIQQVLKSYANSHTEDDYTGVYCTRLLKQAEDMIKGLVNAGPDGRIILTGTGATGALERLQKIIGIYQAPMTHYRTSQCIGKLKNNLCSSASGEEDMGKEVADRVDMAEEMRGFCPVVFVGPYEHHSNELMWRESLAEVVVIRLNEQGFLDLRNLEKKLSDPKYASRSRFASFSAGSNITGLLTDVYQVARLCHRYDTPVFFDFAAIAPYEEIDMNRDEESYFDAIFFSPHKFLGGPGAAGVLIFNRAIYNEQLPPTTAAGGTVDYVGFEGHDFAREIETREKPGTPGILQAVKAALVLELKEKIGVETIRDIERSHAQLFFSQLEQEDNVQFLGPIDSRDRVPIISFNIKHRDRILHPKFVTKLLNDLFGIQSRAGCSCAGPYGHILLGIDEDLSQRYRQIIRSGYFGFKPGWVRINLHFTFTAEDIEFLIQAVQFVAEYGHLFLHLYEFFVYTGEWRFIGFGEEIPRLSVENSFETRNINPSELPALRQAYLEHARQHVSELQTRKEPKFTEDDKGIEPLKYFYYIHVNRSRPQQPPCCAV